MPNIVTDSTEDISETATIVRVVEILSTGTVTTGTFQKCDATAGAIVLTLPSANINDGRVLIFKKIDVTANAVTITAAGSDVIDGAGTYVLSAQYDSVTLINDVDDNDWHVIAEV